MQKLIALSLLLTALAFSGRALAVNADAGLYDPVPPEDSAFVRFVSTFQTSGSDEVQIDGKSMEYISFQELSSYFVAPGGKADIRIGDTQRDFELSEGKFYTVVLKGRDELHIYEDDANDNLARAQIIFYNFSPQKSLSLKTADGKIEVLPAVAANGKATKEINPVKVSLAVYDGDRVLHNLGPISLERSRSYNVIAYPNNDVKWAPSQTNTTR